MDRIAEIDEIIERHALNAEMGAVVEVLQGDCFIVVNHDGECWDGKSWVARWTDAIRFQRPDPAYELCKEAVDDAERITGVAGEVCYIPPGTPSSFVLSPFPDFSQVDFRDLALSPELC